MSTNSLQLTLRNALTLARSAMKLTEENYRFLMAAVTALTNQTYVALGVGEDVATRSAECELTPEGLSVDAASATPGLVTFQKVHFDSLTLLKEVVLEGNGVTYEVKKSYPPSQPPTPDKTFAANQMPLGSDNFTLLVTIQPGGTLKRALMLLELPC